MTQRTAVYRFYDSSDALLYVGVTADFGKRWRGHVQSKPWWSAVEKQVIGWCDTREAALQAEKDAIGAERPLYNGTHSALPAATGAENVEQRTRRRDVSTEMAALQKATTEEYERAAKQLADARAASIAAAVKALQAGEKPTEVARRSPFTSAYIRQIARAHDVPPDERYIRTPRES